MRGAIGGAAVLVFAIGAFAAPAVRAERAFPLPTPGPGAAPLAGAAADYVAVLEPDRAEPEWWAGAPSVVRAPDGVFWLAARMRDAVSPRGLRGYEIRILKSADGIAFEKALSIRREDVPIPGFERPALLHDPETGGFDLYACGPWNGGPWSILKFDSAASPAEFDAKSARVVLAPIPPTDDRDVVPAEYKDPVVARAGGRLHMYVIGVMRRTERVYHFESADGESWAPVGSPYESILDLDGWHDFYVRPASVLSLGAGYLFAYEGSNVAWRDPVYNIGTGIGFTFDLHRIRDLTPDGPLFLSSTPRGDFATFRYSSWLRVGDEIRVYAEAVRPDGAHEIRLIRLREEDLGAGGR